MHLTTFILAVALLTAAFAHPAMAADSSAIWEPDGPWQLDQQPDQCSLLRRFASGDQHLSLQFQPTFFSTSYDVILAGSGVAAGLKPGKVRFSLEGSDKEQVVDGQPGTATGSSAPLLRWTVSDDGAFPDSVGEDQIVQIAMPDQFAAALNLRGAKKALAAVRDCQDRIAAAQDVDAPAVRRQSSAPVPANHPGYWVTFQDYPQEAMRAHMQGIAKFRLTIDRKGLVDACHITSTSGYTLLDEETCKLLKARARFKPALGADRQPSIGYYSNRISWAIP